VALMDFMRLSLRRAAQREVGNLGSPIVFVPCTLVRTWGTPTLSSVRFDLCPV
jgi:hypothetical protein